MEQVQDILVGREVEIKHLEAILSPLWNTSGMTGL